jgi:hypothetical protein
MWLPLLPALAAQPPQYWPPQWPQGWLPGPYYPQPPTPRKPVRPPPAAQPEPARSEPAPAPAEPAGTEQAVQPDPAAAPEAADTAAPTGDDDPVQATAPAPDSAPAQELPPSTPDSLPPTAASPPGQEGQAAAPAPTEPVTDPVRTDRSDQDEPAVTTAGAAGSPAAAHPDPAAEVETARADDTPDGTLPADLEQRHERALQAMRAGNYAEAFCIWRPLAKAGDAQAQFSLGWMYHNGYGLAIDDDQTLHWWEQAAAQQLADAAFALGMLFSFGDGGGIERDVPRAANHYLQAARLGHEEAKAMLRTLLEREPDALAQVTTDWRDAEWQLISSPASIKVDRANVRKRPSLKAEILTRLVLGDEVLQLGREGRWVHIAIPNRLVSAWVHESLLE